MSESMIIRGRHLTLAGYRSYPTVVDWKPFLAPDPSFPGTMPVMELAQWRRALERYGLP